MSISNKKSPAFIRAALFAVASAAFLTSGLLQAAQVPVWRTDLVGTQTKTENFLDFAAGGGVKELKLTGSNTTAYFDFAVADDEIVTAGKLNLSLTGSPSLLAKVSQINVYLNGNLQQTVAIDEKVIGKNSTVIVGLDPKAVKQRANQIRLEFVGHYAIVCENAGNPSIWVDISPSSTLELTKSFVRLPNELSQFPTPFVSPQGAGRATVLPFVFDGKPTDTAVTAAAVLAGYAGSLSEWGPAEFPVYINEMPAQGHFIIFATNERHVAAIKDQPEFEGPEVRIADVGTQGYEKMLVVGGRNDAELLVAVKALTAGGQMIGSRYRVRDFKDQPAAEAYSAPNWINTDEVIPLKALMTYPEQLTARGASLPPLTIVMRLAPDTFAVQGSEAELNLYYRYSKPADGQVAQMHVQVNGALAGSENFPGDRSNDHAELTLPHAMGLLSVPGAQALGLADMTNLMITADYSSDSKEGTPENCRTVAPAARQLQIDPSSTIAFSGFYHYAALPELSLYTKSGFPFSKYADLSQTIAVIPADAEPLRLTTLFNAVSRISSATGAVPVHITVTSDLGHADLQKKDVLYVGDLPAGITEIDAAAAKKLEDFTSAALKKTPETSDVVPDPESTPLAAIVSVPAPGGQPRTAVALLSEGEAGAAMLNAALSDRRHMREANGGIAFVTENGISSFEPVKQYWTGNLPWFQQVWHSLADKPFVLVLCALIAAVIAGVGLYFFMRRWLHGRASR